MPPTTTTVRTNNNLYFIVGGLVAALILGVFAYNTGYFGSNAVQTIPNGDDGDPSTGATTP